MSQAILELLGERLGDALLATHAHRGDETALLAPLALVAACRLLHDHPRWSMTLLMDLTAVDYLGYATPPPESAAFPSLYLGRQRQGTSEAPPWRFEVVYHLYSPVEKRRVRLKVPLGDLGDDDAESTPEVDSVAGVWANADWYEREAWDLYGIRFAGHPGLRRILTYEEFVGHALRKDYPKEHRQPLARHAVLTPR